MKFLRLFLILAIASLLIYGIFFENFKLNYFTKKDPKTIKSSELVDLSTSDGFTAINRELYDTYTMPQAKIEKTNGEIKVSSDSFEPSKTDKKACPT